jgi:hypothetical protein
VNKPVDVRTALMEFAYAMERTLRKHDRDKGRNIKDVEGDYSLGRIHQEVQELDRAAFSAVNDPAGMDVAEEVLDRIQEECTDVANFAAMLWWWAENKRAKRGGEG